MDCDEVEPMAEAMLSADRGSSCHHRAKSSRSGSEGTTQGVETRSKDQVVDRARNVRAASKSVSEPGAPEVGTASSREARVRTAAAARRRADVRGRGRALRARAQGRAVRVAPASG